MRNTRLNTVYSNQFILIDFSTGSLYRVLSSMFSLQLVNTGCVPQYTLVTVRCSGHS